MSCNRIVHVRSSKNSFLEPNNCLYRFYLFFLLQLYFLTDNGLLCDLDITETKEDNKFLHTPNIQSIGVPKHQKIQNFYLLDPETVFCITGKVNQSHTFSFFQKNFSFRSRLSGNIGG